MDCDSGPRWSDWLGLLLVFALNSTLYGHLNARAAQLSFEQCWDVRLFAMDHSWPLWPWTVWIYASYPPLLFLSFRSMRSASARRRFLLGLLLLNFASDLLFLLCPSAMLRPDRAIDPSLATSFLRWIWSVDAARSCCPSLHVSVSLLTALAIPESSMRFRRIALLWCLTIAASTLTTAQHCLIDLIAGAGLALLVDFTLRRAGARDEPRPARFDHSPPGEADDPSVSQGSGGSSLGLIA